MAEAPTVCASCGNHLRPHQHFCPDCGAAVDQNEDRRLVTILFADLASSTTQGGALDPEALRFALASCFESIGRLIQRYGGTLGKLGHDSATAFFGARVARDDDAERAVRAALDIEAALAQLKRGTGRPPGLRRCCHG
jgi:class 3 adenylate cyclase